MHYETQSAGLDGIFRIDVEQSFLFTAARRNASDCCISVASLDNVGFPEFGIAVPNSVLMQGIEATQSGRIDDRIRSLRRR